MTCYIVSKRDGIKDQAELATFSEVLGARLAIHREIPRAFHGHQEVLEDAVIEGISILEFPTFDGVKACLQPSLSRSAQASVRARRHCQRCVTSSHQISMIPNRSCRNIKMPQATSQSWREHRSTALHRGQLKNSQCFTSSKGPE